MMKIERTKSPQSLKENSKKWGREYKENLGINIGYSFHWHNRYDEIERALFDMADNHCSFCDIQPLKASGATVEHFRPKRTFPLLAYVWANLFYACSNCQKKGKQFDVTCKPLKPDQLNYSFKYYFIFVETVEEVLLKPNPARLPEEQERADETIRLYGLNKFARPEARKAELEDYREDIRLGKNKDKKYYSYRFILE